MHTEGTKKKAKEDVHGPQRRGHSQCGLPRHASVMLGSSFSVVFVSFVVDPLFSDQG